MKSQNCKYCAKFTAYYRQWAGCFERLDCGFYGEFKEIKSQSQCCQHFKSNELKEKSRENARLVYLDLAVKSILEISQILKEKEEFGE